MNPSIRKTKRIVCFLLFSFALPTAYSASYDTNNTWYAGIGAGYSWNHLDSSTTIANGITPTPSPPFDQDSYSIKSANTKTLQFTAGYRWYFERRFLPYVSLSGQYRHYFVNQITGDVTLFSLPAFLNYNYQMDFESDTLMLNGKFDLVKINRLMPYFSIGLGGAQNYVTDYQETALPDVTARVSPGFTGKTSTHLAGTLGVGFDFILTKGWWLTLGYEHVFQGGTISGYGTSTWGTTRLNFGNTKFDTVFLELSAAIPEALGDKQ